MSRPVKLVLLFVLCIPGRSSLIDGQTLGSFIPKEYTLLDSVTGNLTLDEYPDAVLVLKNKLETDTSNSDRPLLILEGISKGKYKLAGRNDHIVLCTGCGGMYGDPYQAVTIEKGSFTVMHYGGSAWRWTQNIIFSYQADTGNFILHQDTGESFHASDPNKVKKITNQKENWDKISFENYIHDYD